MATTNPELVGEWHASRNLGVSPEEVRAGTAQLFWWQCSKRHEWQARGADRCNGSKCPYCSNHKVKTGEDDMMTTPPALGAELARDLNGDVTAHTITARSSKRLWWRCADGHEWAAPAYSRARTEACVRNAGGRFGVEDGLADDKERGRETAVSRPLCRKSLAAIR